MFTEGPMLSTELSTKIPHMPSIFAIIVHFGSRKTTDRAVASCNAHADSGEHCIVIDHGSIPDVPNNKGYAAGLMAGVRNAGAQGAVNRDILLFVNNDIEFEHHGIEQLRSWWGIYGGPRTIAGPSWGSVSFITGRATITGDQMLQHFFRMPYVHGACIVMEYGLASLLTFPEEFFMYWEDVALSIHAQKTGARIIRIPFPLIRHNDAGGHISQEKLYYLVRNGAYVLEHEAPWGWTIWWRAINTLRSIYHALLRSHKHQIIARALRDARMSRLGKVVL